MNSKIFGLCMLGALALPAAAQQSGDPQRAYAVNSACAGCHSIPGYQASFPQVYRVPMIAGQSARYIEAALQAYKRGERSHAHSSAPLAYRVGSATPASWKPLRRRRQLRLQLRTRRQFRLQLRLQLPLRLRRRLQRLLSNRRRSRPLRPVDDCTLLRSPDDWPPSPASTSAP